MIRLEALTKNIPSGDYVIEKEDLMEKTICNLTPKFIGNWEIVLIDPSIVFTLDLINNEQFPEWIDVVVCTNKKKIDRIVEVKPAMAPKEETVREAYEREVSTLSHIISPKASKYLFTALRNNKEVLLATLHKLDSECKASAIELKDVQAEVVRPNIVYASKVVDSFLTGERQRWKLLAKLVSDIGQEVAYYAARKYVNKLIKEKNAYLHNEDVKLRILGTVPAPNICLLYYLFATSTTYTQLTAIFMQYDLRCDLNIEED